MRVLQVEDDVTTAKAVERMLQSKGYECQTTTLGQEAVELAKGNEYDIILLDIMLPDMDGFEVLRQLQDARVRTPVVIQSGLVERDPADTEPGFGVTEYLVKPFTKQELTQRIDSALSESKSAEADAPAGAPHEPGSNKGVAEDGSRRRQSSRVRTLKSAQIIYNTANCVIDCLVLNMSEGGAALQPADFVELPETFLLKIQHGPMFSCHVRWQHGNKIGVRFLQS